MIASIHEQCMKAESYARMEKTEAERSALRSAEASAELLLAQQKAELDAHEIRNSSRIRLQSLEARFASEVEELNIERRRVVVENTQRTDALNLKLQSAIAAENSARLAAKANADEANMAVMTHGNQATEAIGRISAAMAEEATQAVSSRDATIHVLQERLEHLTADASRREEDNRRQKGISTLVPLPTAGIRKRISSDVRREAHPRAAKPNGARTRRDQGERTTGPGSCCHGSASEFRSLRRGASCSPFAAPISD